MTLKFKFDLIRPTYFGDAQYFHFNELFYLSPFSASKIVFFKKSFPFFCKFVKLSKLCQMNKTLSNPAADLLNRVCSCFCRALREGACRLTGTRTSRLHIKHTFLKYFLKNIYFSRRTFSARRISPCWTPGCLTSKKAFFLKKSNSQFCLFQGGVLFPKRFRSVFRSQGRAEGRQVKAQWAFPH